MFYWRVIVGSLDDNLGLAVLKFLPLHKMYLFGLYTGNNVGLSIFQRLISINVHCIYRRTHIKTFEDDMHYLNCAVNNECAVCKALRKAYFNLLRV